MGSRLTLGNKLSEETHTLTKQKNTGKGRPGREQQGKGTQENCSATWLAVSGFMGMGLVSGLSPCLAKVGGFGQRLPNIYIRGDLLQKLIHDYGG